MRSSSLRTSFLPSRTPLRLAGLGLAGLFAPRADAATVSYAGVDTGIADRWRSTAYVKPLDADADNVYGSAGWALYGGTLTQQQSNPSFATVATAPGTVVFTAPAGCGTPGVLAPLYLCFDNAPGSGVTVPDVRSGVVYRVGTSGDFVVINVTQTSSFRVGVPTDHEGAYGVTPAQLRLRQTAGAGAGDSGLIASVDHDLDGDFYFFDVIGAQPGDQFTLSGTDDPAHASNGVWGVTFDTLVGPSSLTDPYLDTSKIDTVISTGYLVNGGLLRLGGIVNVGSGADGACSVSGTVNLSTQSCSGRPTADAIETRVTSPGLAVSETVLTVASGSGFAAGDEVVLWDAHQGAGATATNLGRWETVRVQSVVGSTITLQTGLANAYENGHVVRMQRVPNYTSMSVPGGAVLTVNAWDGSVGGALFARVSGSATIAGAIDLSGRGYRGSATMYSQGFGWGGGFVGETARKSNSAQHSWFDADGFGGGGGGDAELCHSGAGGGGGGYGSAGGFGGWFTLSCGGYNPVDWYFGLNQAVGGSAYGDADLMRLFFGGGGGGGGVDGDNPDESTVGGAGGGVVALFAGTVTVTGTGTINASGGNGQNQNPAGESGSGGGGAGGSLLLQAVSLDVGSFRVTGLGGAGGGGGGQRDAGAGGDGRIALRYSILSGVTVPSPNTGSLAPTTSGVAKSTNLLGAVSNVEAIDRFVITSATFPASTSATVQFSQNGATWYSAGGVLGGSTAVSAGTNSVDLTALGWSGSNFYYRFNLTGGGGNSPSVDAISVQYCADAGPDSDVDGLNDRCDPDDDGDGLLDGGDNCPLIDNVDQADVDKDARGDLCDSDDDGDSIADVSDNCPLDSNPAQTDTDGDKVGDACDLNDDGDAVLDATDNCPLIVNDSQADIDADTVGDACDADDDGDGFSDLVDNCPIDANPTQADADKDLYGDACDKTVGANLIGQWTFEPGEELLDLTGHWDPLTLHGGAQAKNGQLDLNDSTTWANALNFNGNKLRSKTLVAWVTLDSLNIRTGSPLTIDARTYDNFDGIIWAENQGSAFQVGSSNGWRGNQPFTTSESAGTMVQVAIAYDDVGGGNVSIAECRNGVQERLYTSGNMAEWTPPEIEALFGPRLTIGDANRWGEIDAHIEESRLYAGALTCAEIGALVPKLDSDEDALLDTADNCPFVANADQKNFDGDSQGDVCDADDDNDGLTDVFEGTFGSSPLDTDSDNDGLDDKAESLNKGNPNLGDTDGDGLGDLVEVGLGTKLDSKDSDGDGLDDKFEVDNGISPTNPDSDGDGVGDAQEVALGTGPNDKDSDNDGVEDGLELTLGGDPLLVDSDGDGLDDFDEYTLGTDLADPDSDNDGLSDKAEVDLGLPPLDSDADNDGLLDGDELTYNADPLDSDSDNDGLSDGDEVKLGGDPNDTDSDNDGLEDAIERTIGTLLTDADTDKDGLTDFQEYTTYHTDPLVPDTDKDGLTDNFEVTTSHTDPLSADTDGDGVKDGVEASVGGDPLKADTDGDGLDDGVEVTLGTAVDNQDSDADGVLDGDEVKDGTDPLAQDSDSDGVTDGDEFTLGSNPLDPDSDGDGLADGDEVIEGTDLLNPDSDNDGLSDLDEVKLGSDPNSLDSDQDGVPDGIEVALGTNPNNVDSDGDGLNDKDEVDLGTDPTNGDSDGDGVSDGVEVKNGGDPSSPDTDQDGIDDVTENLLGLAPDRADTDGDGLLDLDEVGADVKAPLDTDKDGVIDARDADDDGDGFGTAEELALGSDPLLTDTDGDGLDDLVEVTVHHTDPTNEDTDGDGKTDKAEVDAGEDPIVDPDGALNALPDAYSTDEDTELIVDATDGVLTNDAGKGLTAALASPAAHGTASVEVDGSFTYQPDPDFFGDDLFIVEVTDKNGDTSRSLVSIEVVPVRDAPVGRADLYGVEAGVDLAVEAGDGVLVNDLDPEGGDVTAELEDQPSKGTLDLAADGGFTYTPDDDFPGEDVFTYRVVSLTDGVASEPVQVQLIGPPPDPIDPINPNDLPPDFVDDQGGLCAPSGGGGGGQELLFVALGLLGLRRRK